jgi:hypothetical protein
MLSRGHHTAIFIVSMFMLLLLKDLLAKFIITCTLKDKLTTWLCLVEGYLSSLPDLVSFKIEQTICSRVRCITKEIPSTDLASNLSNFFPFFRIKHLRPKTGK